MSDNSLSPVVVKIGGSLLEMKDLAARLRGLFSLLSPAPIAIVVGGGAAVDVVRELDRTHVLGDEEAHWLAIRAMRVGEGLVAALLPECVVVEAWSELAEAWGKGRAAILALEPLLREAEQHGREIPRSSWDVTSDSLAAWAAREMQSARLVLVKSVAMPVGGIVAAVQLGKIDARTPQFAANLDVDWVNLREEPLDVRRLASQPAKWR